LREIELRVDETLAEPLSDALLAAGALAVTISDADADTAAESALFGEPGFAPTHAAWRHNVVVALVDDGVDAPALLASAWSRLDLDGRRPGAATLPRLLDRPVPDDDWVRRTQAQFKPVQIGARLWIVPSWHEPPDPSAVVVRLDPGVAFGTGTHPTTRLCLSWLEQHLRPGARVMDYGCGSGVLSIAAARLGAGAVEGIDLDPQAVAAARDNARRNGVSARYTAAAQRAPRAPAPGASGTIGPTYDVVLANILTHPLTLLAPLLSGMVAPGGHLVLSGILERQAGQVIAAYVRVAPALPLAIWACDDGWVALVGRHAGAAGQD
jgi:ribosomal protein L11 methyltransferase